MKLKFFTYFIWAMFVYSLSCFADDAADYTYCKNIEKEMGISYSKAPAVFVKVIGKGRVDLYSGPNERCNKIISFNTHDTIEVFPDQSYKGWAYVTGNEGMSTGWILENRIGPYQKKPRIVIERMLQLPQKGFTHTVGVCHPIKNKLESKLSAINGMSPVGDAISHIEAVENKKFDDTLFMTVYKSAKMTLLQPPTHGKLHLWTETQTGRYLSNDYNYQGADQASVLVNIGNYMVNVIYHFKLMSNVPGSGDEGTATDDKSICPNGETWLISNNS